MNLYISNFYGNYIPLELINIIKNYLYELYFLDIIKKYSLFSPPILNIHYINIRKLIINEYLNKDFIIKYYFLFKHFPHYILTLQPISPYIFEIFNNNNTTQLYTYLSYYYNNPNINFSEKFILKYNYIYSINKILIYNRNINLSDNFIIKYSKYINIANLITYRRLSNKLIDNFHTQLNWSYKYSEYFEYNIIHCDDKYLIKYCMNDDNIWKLILSKSKKKLSFNFIKKFHKQLHWTNVINNTIYKLPIKYLNKYVNKINFSEITNIFYLPIRFIEMHKKKFWWYELSKLSHFNVRLVKKFIKYINLNTFFKQNKKTNFDKIIIMMNYNIHWYNNIYKHISFNFIQNSNNITNMINFVNLLDFEYDILNYDIKFYNIIKQNTYNKPINKQIKYEIIIFLICINNSFINNKYLIKHKHIINKYIIYLKGYNFLLFINKYSKIDNFLNWNIISTKQLSTHILNKYHKFLNWNIISKHINLNQKNLLLYKKINWNIISKRQLNFDILYRYKKYLNWNLIIKYQSLITLKSFLLHYPQLINFDNIFTIYKNINLSDFNIPKTSYKSSCIFYENILQIEIKAIIKLIPNNSLKKNFLSLLKDF